MMPPHNTPIPELVAETGISDTALYTWRKKPELRQWAEVHFTGAAPYG